MTICDLVLNLLLAFLAVVAALWYEALGAPRLIIENGKTTDDVKDNGRRTRFIHLTVLNNPRKAPFVTRQTAQAAHGTIEFLDAYRSSLSGRMPIRWDAAPEPVKYEAVGRRAILLPDPRLVRISRFIDIFPDERESLAVAIRIFGDYEAYGWTSESYFRDWRHPDFSLPLGALIARVRLAVGDTVVQKDVPFNNPGQFEEFDIVQLHGDA